jgi:hypothetical protein
MIRHTGILAFVALTVVAGALASPAGAEIVLRQKYPKQGDTAELFVQDDDGAPVAGATVTVTYRPGSSVEASDTVGTTGAGGRIAWTPTTAGIASLTASWEGNSSTTNVSVRFASVPPGGVIIMILAGLLLVGGSIVRITRVIKST